MRAADQRRAPRRALVSAAIAALGASALGSPASAARRAPTPPLSEDAAACRQAAFDAEVARRPGALVSLIGDGTPATSAPDPRDGVADIRACGRALTETRDCVYASHMLDVLDGPVRSPDLAKLVAWYPAEDEPLTCLIQASALPLSGRDVTTLEQLDEWAARSVRGHVVYDEPRLYVVALAERDFAARGEDLMISVEATHTSSASNFDIQDLFVAVPKVIASQGEAKPTMMEAPMTLELMVEDAGWQLWQSEEILDIEGESLNRVAVEPYSPDAPESHFKIANLTGRAWGFAFGLGAEAWPLPGANGRVVPLGHFYAMTHVYFGRMGRYRTTVDVVGRGFDIRRHLGITVGAEISDDLLETPLDELVLGLRMGIPGTRPGHPWHHFGGFVAAGLSEPLTGTVTTTTTVTTGTEDSETTTQTQQQVPAYGAFQPKVIVGVDYAF